MKSNTLSIKLLILILLTGIMVACSSPGQGPAAMVQDDVQESAPDATPAIADTGDARSDVDATDDAGGATATPAATIADEASNAVTWHPDAQPIALETVAAGFTEPLFVTNAGDGGNRLYVVEQPGTIRVIDQGTVVATPFLDIRDRVNDGASEQGLLGLAFSPDYAESGHFFVNYTNASGATVIARYAVSPQDPMVADPASERILLTIDQPAGNHNGGMVLFGPDDNLYIGMGDGGAANDRFGNGQNPATLLGKMLRIDVMAVGDEPYAIPADNPWIGVEWNGETVREEIWAVGLRNPWRFSFDPDTGDLWLADVGQNQYEEVNHVPANHDEALNFGWPIMEGVHCFGRADCDTAGLWQPIFEYDHRDGCSVTGGYVYRGAAFPALDGVYFFGDYCSGKLWATLPQGAGSQPGGSAETVEVLDTDLNISSFGEDEAGELYLTDIRGGTVQRLVLVQ